MIAACEAGEPGVGLTAALFRHGFADAVVASTEPTSPTPLWPVISTEIDGGAVLVSGLTVGLGMRAIRRSYLEDAKGSLSYTCVASTPPLAAQNLQALTVYGDLSFALRAAVR